MIIKIGKIEEKILDYLRDDPRKNIDMCLKVYGAANFSTRTKISQSCSLLMKKKLIRKEGMKYYFIKDLGITSKIRGNKQKIVTVPKRQNTKGWKAGDTIKLVNLSRK